MELLNIFNALDLLIIGSIAASLLVSVLRGGMREVASIVALVAGFYLAASFYALGSEHIFRITSHQEVNDTISFLVIFMFVGGLASYAGGQITEIIKKAKLWGWNLMFGVILGGIRGILVACFIVYALLVMLPHDSSTFTKSVLFPYAAIVSERLAPVGPKSFREDFNRKLSHYRKAAAKKAGLPEAATPEIKLPIAPSNDKNLADKNPEEKPAQKPGDNKAGDSLAAPGVEAAADGSAKE
jgi:membrane protein required for colicin V production